MLAAGVSRRRIRYYRVILAKAGIQLQTFTLSLSKGSILMNGSHVDKFELTMNGAFLLAKLQSWRFRGNDSVMICAVLRELVL